MGVPLFDSIIEKLKKYMDNRLDPDASWEDRWAVTDMPPFSAEERRACEDYIKTKLQQAYTQKGQMTQADVWKLELQMDFLRAYNQAYLHRGMHPLAHHRKAFPEEKYSKFFAWFKKRVDSIGETE